MPVTLVEQQPEDDLCGFDSFWILQLKKVGRLEALREWQKIDPAFYPEIIAKWAAWRAYYIAKEQDPQYLLDPRRWLHCQRWYDELPKMPRQAAHVPVKPSEPFVRGEMPEHVRQLIAKLKRG